MSLDIDNIKKRIFFRSSHRGTKEMDILLTSFVDSILDKLDLNQLNKLDKFINLDDEEIMNIKNEKNHHRIIKENEIYKFFLEFKIR